MIWANPRNIRRVEPSRPISTVRLQDADLQLTGLTGARGMQAGDLGPQLRRAAPDPSDKFRCRNCGYWNSEKAQRCKQCVYLF